MASLNQSNKKNNNRIPNNRMTKDEFVRELLSVKYKFLPKSRRSLERMGYRQCAERTYTIDTKADTTSRAMFKAETRINKIDNISYMLIIDFECPASEISFEIFKNTIEPFNEAVIDVFGFHNVTNPVFVPYIFDDLDDKNSFDEKGLALFFEHRAFYAQTGEDKEGRIMQIISIIDETVPANINTRIRLNLVKYREKSGE